MTGLSQPEHRGYSSLTLFLSLATFLLTDMLEYAVVEEINCPNEGFIDVIIRDTPDYICFRDVDTVPFAVDVDRFVAERNINLNAVSGWLTDDVGLSFKVLFFKNGYSASLFESVNKNAIILAGTFLPEN